jgi:hypothetical protein
LTRSGGGRLIKCDFGANFFAVKGTEMFWRNSWRPFFLV